MLQRFQYLYTYEYIYNHLLIPHTLSQHCRSFVNPTGYKFFEAFARNIMDMLLDLNVMFQLKASHSLCPEPKEMKSIGS
jgi:hypothetical protein